MLSRIFSGRSATQTLWPGCEPSHVIHQQIAAGLRAAHRDQARLARRHRAFEEVGRADEVGDKPALGELVDFRRRAHLHYLAAVHDGNARRERHRLVLVVRHDDECDTHLVLQVH